MASARCEVACQSVLQKFSYTLADGDLLDRGSVIVRSMRVFAVANEMDRSGVSGVAFASSSETSGWAVSPTLSSLFSVK